MPWLLPLYQIRMDTPIKTDDIGPVFSAIRPSADVSWRASSRQMPHMPSTRPSGQKPSTQGRPQCKLTTTQTRSARRRRNKALGAARGVHDPPVEQALAARISLPDGTATDLEDELRRIGVDDEGEDDDDREDEAVRMERE